MTACLRSVCHVAEASITSNPASHHDVQKQQQQRQQQQPQHPSSVFSVAGSAVQVSQPSSASPSLQQQQHALMMQQQNQNQQQQQQAQKVRVLPEDMAMKREVFSLEDDTSVAADDDMEDRSALHAGFSDLLKIPPLRYKRVVLAITACGYGANALDVLRLLESRASRSIPS